MPPPNSAIQTLRSTFIIGAASGLNILVGIARAKVVALLLGPAGMGSLSLLSGIMTAASALAGMGMASSGARQLAASAQDAKAASRVQRALWMAHIALGVLGGLAVWALREPIARWVLGDSHKGGMVGWLGVGVFLSLMAACQTAIQQGLRHIAEMARVSVAGTLVGTAGGLVAIWQLGEAGVLISVILLPACTVLVAAHYGRHPRFEPAQAAVRELIPECRAMMGLGVALMITAVMAEATQLAIRSVIRRELGLDATGHFFAAWTISMQYVGFVLGAMSADYLPRLSEAIHDRSAANKLVAEQAEISLLLAGPVILCMLAMAPWIIEFLYSQEFGEAVPILRWQILGDFLKIAAWPLGFVLIAKARSKLFVMTETLWLATYLLLVGAGLPLFGLKITGIAFCISYLIYFAAVMAAVYGTIGFRYQATYAWILGTLLAAGLLTLLVASEHSLAGAAVGLALGAISAVYSLFRLTRMVESADGVAGRIAGKFRLWRTRMGFRRA